MVSVDPSHFLGFTQSGNACPSSTLNLRAQSNQNGMQYQWLDHNAVSLGSGTVNGMESSLALSLPNLNDSTICYTLFITNPFSGCTESAQHCVHVGGLVTNTDCRQIYVTPTGSPTGAGIKMDPMSLAAAVQSASCNGLVIRLAIGNYTINQTLNKKLKRAVKRGDTVKKKDI